VVTASSSPLSFVLLTCSGKVKGIKVWQRDTDSAAISGTQTLACFWGSHSTLCAIPLLLAKWKCWAPLSFGEYIENHRYWFLYESPG